MKGAPSSDSRNTSDHTVIAFAGQRSPACQAASATLELPHLAALLARMAMEHDDAQPAESLSPPHERALAAALGLPVADGLIPWAAQTAGRKGLAPAPSGQGWGFVTWCHWDVAIDQVVLDAQSVGPHAIDAADSDALMQSALPWFAQDGITLHPTAKPGRWLGCGALFVDMPTASLDRVAGQPIGDWLEPTPATRPLRKLQGEMEMLLYNEPVNDGRAARGLPSINAFWASGTGALDEPAPIHKSGVALIDDLRYPALADDGVAWAATWQAIDAGVLADLLRRQRSGEPVTLTLCGDRSARRFVSRPPGIAKRIRSLFGRFRPSSLLEQL